MGFPKLTGGEWFTVIIALMTAGIVWGRQESKISVLEEKVKEFYSFVASVNGVREAIVRLEVKLEERSMQDNRLELKLDRIEDELRHAREISKQK